MSVGGGTAIGAAVFATVAATAATAATAAAATVRQRHLSQRQEGAPRHYVHSEPTCTTRND